MDVVPIGLDSPQEQLDAWVTLFQRYEVEVLPHVDPPGARELHAKLDSDHEFEHRAVLAIEGGEPVGAMVTSAPKLESPLWAWGELYVTPQRRRKGIGRALLEHAATRLREDGRKRLGVDAPAEGPGMPFCFALGGEGSQADICSVLEVNDVDWPAVDAWASSVPAGYRLVQWSAACPDDLVDAFADAVAAMNDAPRGEALMEDMSWTADRVRKREQRRARWDWRVYTTVAVHEASGVVAGFTEIVDVDRPRSALQDDTAVVRAHRGHGLGLAIKSANLLWVRDTAPRIERLVTWNAEDNPWMRAVNERMGYRPVARWLDLSLPL